MSYKIKHGERIEHGIARAQVHVRGTPWANIFADCCGDCSPQQSIGLRFTSNAEVDSFTDAEANAIFVQHGWTHA
jgi:hypothetical protein